MKSRKAILYFYIEFKKQLSMFKKVLILVGLFLSTLHLNAQKTNEFKKMDFLIGNWKFNAKSLMPDGSYQPQVFYSKVESIFGGNAHRDNFHYKNQNGDLILYGSTIRSYNIQSGKWKMLWYNYNLSHITEMSGDFKNNEFHFQAKGRDAKGEYIEKITFYNISKDSYSWKSDKSYDKGQTWLKKHFSYDAERIVK